MPSKQIGIRFRAEFIKFLDDHVRSTDAKDRTAYIHEAIVARLGRETDQPIPPPAASEGRQASTLQPGWRSLLYRDRYQLALIYDPAEEFVPYHWHEFDEVGGNQQTCFVLRSEEPYPLEAYTFDVPEAIVNKYGMDRLQRSAYTVIMEWLPDNNFEGLHGTIWHAT